MAESPILKSTRRVSSLTEHRSCGSGTDSLRWTFFFTEEQVFKRIQNNEITNDYIINNCMLGGKFSYFHYSGTSRYERAFELNFALRYK